MTLRRILCLTALLGIAACGDAVETVDENTRYVQLSDDFETLEACQAAAGGSAFACVRRLTLCTNGGYTLNVTDISNEGVYSIEGDTIVGRQGGAGDGPERFTGKLGPGRTSFTSPELSGRHPWRKVTLQGEERLRVDEDCEVLPGRDWWREMGR
jgi:hypothetical protein